MVEEDVDLGGSEQSTHKSREPSGIQPSITASLVVPTPAAVPCERAAPAGGRGTAAATSLRRTAMGGDPGSSVQNSAGTPGGGAMSTPYATSTGVNASGGTVSPGASVEQSSSVSEGDEADDSPSPELGGSAAREPRWLGENPVVRQGRTRGEQRQLDMDTAALIVEEAPATEELREWLSVSVMHDCLTGTNGLYNPLLLGAVYDTEDLAASAIDFAPGVWLDPLLDSRNGFGAVCLGSTFASVDLDCSEFPH